MCECEKGAKYYSTQFFRFGSLKFWKAWKCASKRQFDNVKYLNNGHNEWNFAFTPSSFSSFFFRESKMIPCSKKIPCNSLLEITLYGRRRNINSIESIILYINNDYILIISKRLELVSYNLQVMQDSVVFLWIKLYPCGQVKGVTKLDPLSKLKF